VLFKQIVTIPNKYSLYQPLKANVRLLKPSWKAVWHPYTSYGWHFKSLENVSRFWTRGSNDSRVSLEERLRWKTVTKSKPCDLDLWPLNCASSWHLVLCECNCATLPPSIVIGMIICWLVMEHYPPELYESWRPCPLISK